MTLGKTYKMQEVKEALGSLPKRMPDQPPEVYKFAAYLSIDLPDKVYALTLYTITALLLTKLRKGEGKLRSGESIGIYEKMNESQLRNIRQSLPNVIRTSCSDELCRIVMDDFLGLSKAA